MRHAVILGAVLLAMPMLGQEDPLPAVTPRATTPPPVYVALAVEPIRETPSVSLEEAARANDYVTFNALFAETGNAAYVPLHELWTYSINDPIGAFYGEEMYARFVRLYPEFAAYIEDHKIVDDRGNVFYPTSETRAFLLARAIEGRTIVAPQEPIRVARAQRRSSFNPTPADAPPASRVRFKKAEAAPAASPVAPVDAPKPAVVPAPMPMPVPVPVQRAAMPIVTAAVIAPAGAEEPDLAARGILLILIGLVGLGFLTLLLRAPGERESSSSASDLGKAPQ